MFQSIYMNSIYSNYVIQCKDKVSFEYSNEIIAWNVEAEKYPIFKTRHVKPLMISFNCVGNSIYEIVYDFEMKKMIRREICKRKQDWKN